MLTLRQHTQPILTDLKFLNFQSKPGEQHVFVFFVLVLLFLDLSTVNLPLDLSACGRL